MAFKTPSRIAFHKATVLTGKLKIMIFEEAVHEDDEFAHAGGHGDEGFLAGGAQAQIKLFEDAVVKGSVPCIYCLLYTSPSPRD